MDSQTNVTFVVNVYQMTIFTLGLLGALFAIVWKGKKEIVETVEVALKPLRDEIKDLGSRIVSHERDIGKLEGKYGEAHSPIKPNEMGRSLLEKSGFNQLYSSPDIKSKLFKSIDQKNTRTLYDAEKNAYLALEELSDDQIMDGIKDYVVNNPDEPLELVFRVASWIIRDDYWTAKHPEKN